MKVYACPKAVPFATDYTDYDTDKEKTKVADHKRRLVEWLKKNGYSGKRTGEIARFPVADGYAEYMLGDGKKSVLIHLPYWDAYDYRDIAYLPKAEVLRRIDADKKISALFAKKENAE